MKLTFDDAPNQYGWQIWPIQPGYGGVAWSNFFCLDTTEDRRTPAWSGYDRVRASAQRPVVALNGFGQPAEIAAPAGGSLTLHRITAAAAYQDGLTLTIIGFRGGKEVARTARVLDPSERTLIDLRALGADFARLDRLRFETSGGRDTDPRDRYVGEGQVAFEDAVLDAFPAPANA